MASSFKTRFGYDGKRKTFKFKRSKRKVNWDVWLNGICTSYNTSIIRPTKTTPHELWFGEKMAKPYDLNENQELKIKVGDSAGI